MNSSTLRDKGFVEFIPIKQLSFSAIPLDKLVVLALADSSSAEKSTSDILFIGKSKKPAKRIFAGYFAGYGGKTSKKINSKLFKDGYLENVSVSWMLSDDPKAAQKQLLEEFKKEQGQYPEWNSPCKKAEKQVLVKKKIQAHSSKKPTKTAKSHA
jgi:hypothetical protein